MNANQSNIPSCPAILGLGMQNLGRASLIIAEGLHHARDVMKQCRKTLHRSQQLCTVGAVCSDKDAPASIHRAPVPVSWAFPSGEELY